MSNKINSWLYRIGANDRRTSLFENNWPLPFGVCYNSYFIDDLHPCLLDTVEFGSCPDYLDQLEALLEGRKLEYLIINHMEPDHAGMIGAVLQRWPEVSVVGNAKTRNFLAAYYGSPCNFIEVREGDSIETGVHRLSFIPTPMIHWPESMMSFESTEKVLFSADAFGSFGTLDGGIFDDQNDMPVLEEEMLRYYSNIVGKYSHLIAKALGKLAGLEPSLVCPLHGPIWRKDISHLVDLYSRWSHHTSRTGLVLAYASMYSNTERMTDYLAERIAELYQKPLKIIIHDVSKTHPSFILRDIWKYKGLVLASCSYNAGMHPMMQHLCHELSVCNPKDKLFGLFGSCTWGGGGLRSLQAFASTTNWTRVAEDVELTGAPNPTKLKVLDSLAQSMVQQLKQYDETIL